MAASDRYTGTNLVVTWLPAGGTAPADNVEMAGSYTTFSINRESDMADTTAGSGRVRTYIPTIEDLTFTINIYLENNDADLVELLPQAEGRLTIRRKGSAGGSPIEAFNAIISSFNITEPFDGVVELEISGSRNGVMVSEFGAVL